MNSKAGPGAQDALTYKRGCADPNKPFILPAL